MNIIDTYGMRKHVTWISGDSAVLSLVKNTDPDARLGLSVNIRNIGDIMITDSVITVANNLKTNTNSVFITANCGYLDNDQIYRCMVAKLPLEVWNLTSAAVWTDMHPYVSGVSSSFFQAGRYLLTI